MIEYNKIIFTAIFKAIVILISIGIQCYIKHIDKGVVSMKDVLSSTLEVLLSFSINVVSGATLSLR